MASSRSPKCGSIRRKSVPKNIASKEQTSYPAGEASPVPTNGPEPIFETHLRPAPRPKSSWYSQPFLSEDALLLPRVPNHYLSSERVQGFTMVGSESAAEASMNSSALQGLLTSASHRVDDDVESPGGTRQNSDIPYMTQAQRTAVSEYLRDRSWTPKTPRNIFPTASFDYPEPNSAPPPVPNNQPLSILRRISVRRGSRRGLDFSESGTDEFASQRQNKSIPQQASRRASSITTTWPYSLLARPQELPETPSSYVSTPRVPDSAYSTTPCTPRTEPLLATPYQAMRQGPAPTPVKTLFGFAPQKPNSADPTAGLKKGLGKHYGKGSLRRKSLTCSSVQNVFAPPSYHTDMHSSRPPYPVTSRSRLLTGSMADARERSNEGCWLFIGTMRGPTPSGVRMINEIMAKSLSKKGNTEKGIKELRKVLRHENRTTIEWIENYVRQKWGVEV